MEFGSHDEMVDLEVVLCEPGLANFELLSAAQLQGKVVLTKEGRCPFKEKAQRVVELELVA